MMKGTLAILILGTAYIASAVPVAEPEAIERDYPRFIQFPDGEGNLHDVDLEAEPDMKLLEEVSRNPNNLYLLFTRRNPNSAQSLFMNNAASITSSNFNAAVPTIIIAHGWLSNRDTEPNPTIRTAFLAKGDVNVITMDWSFLSLSDYTTAVRGIPDVGQGLGQFLNFLSQATGASLSTMHLAGFSLGAHVVGNAGRATGGRIARVTGLDPAGPLWVYNRNRLGPNDGVYVEAIHTDGGYGALGIGFAIANVDFFPNGGISQPGCSTSLCNHNRAWELFAASVTYNHLIGRECSSTAQILWNTCRGNYFHLGNDILNKSGSGMYRLDASATYPY